MENTVWSSFTKWTCSKFSTYREMHASCDISFPIFCNTSNATKPHKNKRILCLNRFTSHRATKTSGIQKLFYSNLFSSIICLISNDSKWFTSELFISLSNGLIASQNPAGKSPRTQLAKFTRSQRLMTNLDQLIHRFDLYTRKYGNYYSLLTIIPTIHQQSSLYDTHAGLFSGDCTSQY